MQDNFDISAMNERLQAVAAKQAELDQERNSVREEALAHCKALCSLFGFTAKELGIASAAAKPARKAATTAKAIYKNPNGNETWSGRGASKPKWFTDALARGITAEEMRICLP